MANKKNPDRINKDRLIRVRVTKEEHKRFIEKAAESGYRSVSDYIRTLIDNKVESSDDAKNNSLN